MTNPDLTGLKEAAARLEDDAGMFGDGERVVFIADEAASFGKDLRTVLNAIPSLLEQLAEAREALERKDAVLRECLADYGSPRFTDRHGMADTIRAALGKGDGHG